jgi:crotonobetainyl-CoA:carnitine CoA-transferase CaiB-like acyl-CoA transferase
MLESMLATDDYVHYSLEDQPLWAARGRIYDAAGGPVLLSGDLKHLWARLRGAGLTDPDPTATGEAKFAGRERAIEAWVRSFTDRAELIRALEAAGVAWAEVRTPATVLDSPSVRAREVVAEVDDRRGGTRPVIRMPYRFSDASSAPRGGAPYVGEHNAEVLAEWADLDADAVAALVASGALIVPQEEAS